MISSCSQFCNCDSFKPGKDATNAMPSLELPALFVSKFILPEWPAGHSGTAAHLSEWQMRRNNNGSHWVYVEKKLHIYHEIC